MSEQEREQFITEIREANQPLVNRITAASIGVIFTFVGCCVYLGGVIRDVQESKQFRVTAEPVINLHTTQIAVINSILKIK